MGALANAITNITAFEVTHNYKFIYNYNPSISTLTFSIIETFDDGTPSSSVDFKFVDPYSTDNSNIEFFLRFLNQQITTAAITKLTTSADVFQFTGVWDRDLLFFHASFSKSHRNMIGRNKDFWTTPSKKYIFTDNTNDFYVYFTTDGVHRIFPYHCNFYLELSFILNYDHSTV